ncbi:hypothetical protein SPHINGO8AM_130255 [Sphingomonas sp. 8AM]|nr:hypothetical protein SPHINGO8AM_130255 [Sphingomonas sp. 8AM]
MRAVTPAEAGAYVFVVLRYTDTRGSFMCQTYRNI